MSTTTTGIEWTEMAMARFWTYVQRGTPDECWPWRGGRFSNGYGQFRLGARKVKAHRCSYILVIGEIQDGLRVLHRCDNPPCCNPAHLFLGTDADNARDRSMKGRSSYNGNSLPGEKNPAAKIKLETVVEIRATYRPGISQREYRAAIALIRARFEP